MADNHAYHYNPYISCCGPSPDDSWLIRCDVGQVTTIEVFPDDALLAIFDFCVVGDQDFSSSGDRLSIVLRISKRTVECWHPLVHVCRRWRGLVLGHHVA